MSQLAVNSFNLQSIVVQKVYHLLTGLQNGSEFYGEIYNAIARDVALGRKLEFVLPAFPAKSANREKTLGTEADLADYLGLKRLNDFARQVADIYEPGCIVHVCSDGRVFVGLVGVADHDVNVYSQSIKRIVSSASFEHLRFFNLEDIFHNDDFDFIRTRLDDEFAESIDLLKRRIHESAEDRFLFNGIHRFLFEDYLVLSPEKSRNQVRKLTKDLSYKVIQRSNSWSRLVAREFPTALRLTIHPQAQVGAKFPVQLVPAHNFWRTPWHSVAVRKGKSFSLMSLSEALAVGGQIKYGDFNLPFAQVEGEVAHA